MLVAALAVGCAIDDSTPSLKRDGGGGTAQTGTTSTTSTTGSGGQATTSSAGGSAGSTGAGGGGGPASGGTAGGGGTAGAGGAGGGDVDASIDDGGPPDVGGPGLPEASTCAGYAFDFSGGNYVSVRRLVDTDFTLEAWIKTISPSLIGTQFYQGNGLIYADVGGINDDYGTAIVSNRFAFGVGSLGGVDTTILSLTDVTTGQWFHVAATRSAATGVIQVFVGGVLEATQTVANTRPLTAQAALTIGGNTIDGRYFIGQMDELRIWNIVRAQGDIVATMHHRLAGNEPGLVGYWRFDDPGSVAVLVDSGPNNESAIPVGVPAWIASEAPVCEPPAEAGAGDAPAATDATATDATDATTD
jgi:hypothetical protein